MQQEEANPLQTAAKYFFIFVCFSDSPKCCSAGDVAAAGELRCLISQERRDDCPAVTFVFDGGGGEKEIISKLTTSCSMFCTPLPTLHPPKKGKSFGATLISGTPTALSGGNQKRWRRESWGHTRQTTTADKQRRRQIKGAFASDVRRRVRDGFRLEQANGSVPQSAHVPPERTVITVLKSLLILY